MRGRLMVIAFLFSFLAFSQQKDPDVENGLGPFKFGTPVSQFEGRVTKTLIISYGQDFYLYEGGDTEVFYNLKVRKTNLGFYKDQLNYIDFYYRKPDNLAFQSLLGQLEEDFGPAEQFNTIDEKGVLEAYRWKSKRVYLQLVRYGEGASDSDDKNMTVLMMELMK